VFIFLNNYNTKLWEE